MNQQLVQDCFEYFPKTGKLFWKVSLSNRVKIGDEAGHSTDRGYRALRIHGKAYMVHQIIFMYMLGYFPEEIDHEDHDRSNNKWDNLRAANSIKNSKNAGMRSDNKSGITGVSWSAYHQKWTATININGKQTLLGRSKIQAEVFALREAANIKYDYHPNHGKK